MAIGHVNGISEDEIVIGDSELIGCLQSSDDDDEEECKVDKMGSGSGIRRSQGVKR